MNLFSLALRNLQRRKGRTILTIIGVAIAVAILFSLLSFSAGYERELTKEMDSLGFHLLAVPKGCPYEATTLILHGGVIPKYLTTEDLARTRATEGVKTAAPVLLQQFVKDGTPHIVYGIEPDAMIPLKPAWKVNGRFFTANETHVMVIGSTLAEKENLVPGSVIPFGPAQEPFTVIGVLKPTGSEDDNFHFLPLADAQRVFSKEGFITAIAVRADDVKNIHDITVELEKVPDIQVVTMAQVTGTIMNLVGSARSLLFSVIVIAIVISAAGITNTLLMSVNERTREIGMMKAIGASGHHIGILLITETLLITLSGGTIGIIAAMAGSGIIETFVRGMVPYAPSGSFFSSDPLLIGGCLVFSIGLGLLCGLYPAWKSARLSPMEAIRGEWE
ncbi:ABC transporter permease [Methanoregula sp. PtaB.Bin085]|uniref:ABC transporter permease n=1 Tax=Methanoregula sp. PtaB.Bin085 TaxID=1811680 RepID=UPI0009CCBC93|nr:ABC transporter permease [Methanoregula sp. PtaB.Bin085]OPX63423.1 MAG: outer membrane-specific lipoprotein transporter subunit LolE [Methanoregula sp. PtaB.Bin085]